MQQYAVIGCGRFGTSVAKTLVQLKNEVLAIDKDPEKVQDISNDVTHAVQADATEEGVLKSVGISNMDGVIISIGTNIQSSILATILVKEEGVKQIITKASNELHAKVLYKVGADQVVFPERDMGVRLAHNLSEPNGGITDYIKRSEEYRILEIYPPKSWIGKTIGDLDIRKQFEVNIIGIDYNDNLILPGPDTIIEESNKLYVLGSNQKLNALYSVRG